MPAPATIAGMNEAPRPAAMAIPPARSAAPRMPLSPGRASDRARARCERLIRAPASASAR